MTACHYTVPSSFLDASVERGDRRRGGGGGGGGGGRRFGAVLLDLAFVFGFVSRLGGGGGCSFFVLRGGGGGRIRVDNDGDREEVF